MNPKIFSSLFLILLSLISHSLSADGFKVCKTYFSGEDLDSDKDIPTGLEVDLGDGYSLSFCEFFSTCTNIQSSSRKSLDSQQYQINRISSYWHFEELLTTLRVPEKEVIELVNEFKSQSNSIFLYTEAVILTGYRESHQVDFSSNALEILREHPQSFGLRCGDSFVKKVHFGGKVFAIIRIDAENFREKLRIADDISKVLKNYPLMRVVINDYRIDNYFNYTKALKEILDRDAVKIRFFQKGKGSSFAFEKIIPSEFQDLIKNFPLKVRLNNEQIVSVKVKKYNHVRNYHFNMGIEVKRALWVVTELNRTIYEMNSKRDSIIYVLEHRYEFVNPNIELLNAKLAEINTLLTKSRDALDSCNNDINRCSMYGIIGVSVILPEKVDRS